MFGKSVCIIAGLICVSSGAIGKSPATPGHGIHTGNRILIPSDDTQTHNFVVHRNIRNKGQVKAPLLWIEYVADENGKSRTMRLKSQNNLSNGGGTQDTPDGDD